MCLVRLTLNVRGPGAHGVWKQRCTCSTQGCIVQAVDPSPFEPSSAAPETVRLAPRSPWDATPRPRRRWRPRRCLVQPARERNEQEGRNNENRTHGSCCSLLAQGSCLWKSVSRIEGNSASVVPAAAAIALAIVIVPATALLGDRAFADGGSYSNNFYPGSWHRGEGCASSYRISHRDTGCMHAWWDNTPPRSTGILGRQHLWGAEQVPRLWRHESKYRNGRMV